MYKLKVLWTSLNLANKPNYGTLYLTKSISNAFLEYFEFLNYSKNNFKMYLFFLIYVIKNIEKLITVLEFFRTLIG